MATSVYYNGVQLVNVLTRQFDQTCVYDESDTDLVNHRFIVQVEGTLHNLSYEQSETHPDGKHHHGIFPIGTYGSPQQVMAAVHAQLMQPRGPFIYKQGDEVVLSVHGFAETSLFESDVSNGPKPRSCNIRHVAGLQCYRVEFTIELNVVKCYSSEQQTSAHGNTTDPAAQSDSRVLSNRWSIEETKDENLYTTRTWDGVLRVRNSGFFPHEFRYLVVPHLQRGYKRMQQRFVQSADGLWLRYTIVDKQMHAAPPDPAVDWSATYSETLTNNATIRISNMTVSLMGGPTANKRALLSAAADVAMARLNGLADRIAGISNNAEMWIHNAMFLHHEHENRVELRVTIQRPAKDTDTILSLAMDGVGAPLVLPNHPSYDPKAWPVPTLFDDNSPAAMFAIYLQGPCSPQHGITGALQGQVQQNPDRIQQAPENAEYYQSNDSEPPQDAGKLISQDQYLGFPYTFIEMDNRYVSDSGYIQLPLARKEANNDYAESTRVFRLHAPIARRIFTMRAERVGKWPDLPRPDEVKIDPNNQEPITETLLHKEMIPDNPELLPDGRGYLYKIQAKFVYALSREPVWTEKLRAPSSPVDTSTPADTYFDGQEHLKQDLIE